MLAVRASDFATDPYLPLVLIYFGLLALVTSVGGVCLVSLGRRRW